MMELEDSGRRGAGRASAKDVDVWTKNRERGGRVAQAMLAECPVVMKNEAGVGGRRSVGGRNGWRVQTMDEGMDER